jgi:hypothetical protein
MKHEIMSECLIQNDVADGRLEENGQTAGIWRECSVYAAPDNVVPLVSKPQLAGRTEIRSLLLELSASQSNREFYSQKNQLSRPIVELLQDQTVY